MESTNTQWTKPTTPATSSSGKKLNNEFPMQECIDTCFTCFQSCSQLIYHCLDMGGEHASRKHIAILADCALICETSAKLMLSGSEFHTEICRLCAEACRTCADSCNQLAGTDQMMKNCADICLKCAASCGQMNSENH